MNEPDSEKTAEPTQSSTSQVAPLQTNETDQVNKESLPRKVSRKIITQVKNLICLIIWTWLICRIIGRPFPLLDLSSLFSRFSLLFDNPTVSLATKITLVVAILGIILFKAYWKVAKSLLFFGARLIFFPIIFIFYVLYVPYKTSSLAYKGVNVFLGGIVKTTVIKAAILLLLLLTTSAIIITNSYNQIWLIVSLFSLMLVLIINLRVAFLWTSKPLIIIEQLLDIYFRMIDFFIRINTDNLKPKEELEDNLKAFEKFKKQIEPFYKNLDWAEEFVARNTDQKIIVKFFILLLATCFSITVFTFGIGYYGLNKLYPNSFADANNLTLFDYIYSSLLVITTSGEIHPTWLGAKIAVSIEILSGICILSLVVFQFSMVSISEVMDNRSVILDKLKAKEKEISDLEEKSRLEMIMASKDIIDIFAEMAKKAVDKDPK